MSVRRALTSAAPITLENAYRISWREMVPDLSVSKARNAAWRSSFAVDTCVGKRASHVQGQVSKTEQRPPQGTLVRVSLVAPPSFALSPSRALGLETSHSHSHSLGG